MAFIRGSYDSEFGALRAIQSGGGLAELWARGATDAGLMPTDRPATGDIGILAIPTDDGLGEACGLWTGERWATLHMRGLMFGFGEPLVMWRGAWAA